MNIMKTIAAINIVVISGMIGTVNIAKEGNILNIFNIIGITNSATAYTHILGIWINNYQYFYRL